MITDEMAAGFYGKGGKINLEEYDEIRKSSDKSTSWQSFNPRADKSKMHEKILHSETESP